VFALSLVKLIGTLGTTAAMMLIEPEYTDNPMLFLAATLNWYVTPDVSPVFV
jgi:hypothetical protein